MTELARCRWCHRALPVQSGPGRPRRYCRHSCRQRDYEARRRASELGISEAEVVMARSEIDALGDAAYVLEAAIQDIEGDLARSDSPEDYRIALELLLGAARPLIALRP